MIQGNCLCRAVRYEVTAVQGPLVHCHCNYCRKTHAAAFSSNLTAQKADFSLISGEAEVKFYESSPGKKRYFCGNCGSSLWHTKEMTPELLTIKTGCIETFLDFEKQPFSSYHIHCQSDKPWLNYEGLIKYEELKD